MHLCEVFRSLCVIYVSTCVHMHVWCSTLCDVYEHIHVMYEHTCVVCEHMCVMCVSTCVCAHAPGGLRPMTSALYGLPLYILRQNLSLNPELASSVRQGSQLGLGLPSLPPQCWDYRTASNLPESRRILGN